MILVLQFLIFIEGDTGGQVDISIDKRNVDDDLSFFSNIVIVAQLDLIVGARYSLLRNSMRTWI